MCPHNNNVSLNNLVVVRDPLSPQAVFPIQARVLASAIYSLLCLTVSKAERFYRILDFDHIADVLGEVGGCGISEALGIRRQIEFRLHELVRCYEYLDGRGEGIHPRHLATLAAVEDYLLDYHKIYTIIEMEYDHFAQLPFRVKWMADPCFVLEDVIPRALVMRAEDSDSGIDR